MRHVRLTNLLLEISYEGNIGLHEMMQFYLASTPEEIEEFESVMKLGDIKRAWDMVQKKLNVQLKGL